MDIKRQCRKLFAQANILLQKFHIFTTDVKVTLFPSLYSSVVRGGITIKNLYVSYHMFKMFLGVPKYEHTSQQVTAAKQRIERKRLKT